jgi:type IV pilus assembly protein PilE
MTRTSGFSLVELMIVVAIIGLLVGISLPAYNSYSLRAHRADAQGVLLDLAARQERFIAQNINTYSNSIDTAAGLNLGRTTSPEGYYDLTVGAGATGLLATSYQLPAYRNRQRRANERYRLPDHYLQ